MARGTYNQVLTMREPLITKPPRRGVFVRAIAGDRPAIRPFEGCPGSDALSAPATAGDR